MVNQIAKLDVKPKYQEAYHSALAEYQRESNKEEGCIAMRAYQDNQNPGLFFIYARWQDDSSLELHRLQPHSIKIAELADKALEAPVQRLVLSETSPAPVELIEATPEDEKFNIFFIFKINPDYRERLLEQFKEHITHTRTEQGCLLFDLFTVDGDDETLVVYEHWRKESDVWDIHFNQPYSKVTGALMEEAVIGDMRQYMNFVKQIA